MQWGEGEREGFFSFQNFNKCTHHAEPGHGQQLSALRRAPCSPFLSCVWICTSFEGSSGLERNLGAPFVSFPAFSPQHDSVKSEMVEENENKPQTMKRYAMPRPNFSKYAGFKPTFSPWGAKFHLQLLRHRGNSPTAQPTAATGPACLGELTAKRAG